MEADPAKPAGRSAGAGCRVRGARFQTRTVTDGDTSLCSEVCHSLTEAWFPLRSFSGVFIVAQFLAFFNFKRAALQGDTSFLLLHQFW